jgi:hypothetical protein
MGSPTPGWRNGLPGHFQHGEPLLVYLKSKTTCTELYFYRSANVDLAWQVNIFMGIGLLSMPFAMKQGGWIGMAALAGATAVFCLSGKLIVRNFDKMPPNTSHTYPALGASSSSGRCPCRASYVHYSCHDQGGC